MLIVQVLPDLSGGGAERVAVNLANHWISSGHQAILLLMKRRGEFLDAVDPRIDIHSIGCTRIRQVPLQLSRYLREHQPDVVLVHMWPLTSAALLAWLLAGKPGSMFVCEHIGLTDHVKGGLSTSLSVVRRTLRISYPFATGVLAVSKGVAKDLAQLARLPEAQVDVMHNPVVSADLLLPLHPSLPQLREKLWEGKFSRHVLTVGSLKAQKNHRLLLQAFAQMAAESDAGLVILGEGHLRAILEQDIRDFGLQGRVVMPGFHSDPMPWFQAADLFVLSSDFEGLPTVLIEAMACGTPVVSTDCPHGPAEILQYGQYGRLVPVGDATALAAAIQASFLEAYDPQVLRVRAQDFAVPRVAEQYLTYFRSRGVRL